MQIIKWSGSKGIPELGEKVKVIFHCPWEKNGDGTGLVKNYIEDSGWIGVNLVRADGKEGVFYGREIKRIEENS